MDIQRILKTKRNKILRIAALHGAHNVRVFGSVIRGEASPDSDIDFIIEFEPGRSLFDIVALQEDLENLLGRKVDIVEPEGIHWYIRDKVMGEAVEV